MSKHFSERLTVAALAGTRERVAHRAEQSLPEWMRPAIRKVPDTRERGARRKACGK